MAFTIFVYNASACGSWKRTVAGELLLLRGSLPEIRIGILCCFVLHATFRHVRAYFRGF